MTRQNAQPQQNASTTQEPEPRVLCGLPVGGAVGILGSILMICQIFGLFYLSPFMLYFFEISIGSGMLFILSTGAKQRKIAYVTAYMLYISMYTFWVFFLILGAVLATVYLVENNDNICGNTTTASSRDRGTCINAKFTTGDVEMVIISCFFLTLSIIVAVIQMRYLMILYHFLRRCAYRLPSSYNVQYVVPTPISPNGMPPPPRYTVNPPPPVFTTNANLDKPIYVNGSGSASQAQPTPILTNNRGNPNNLAVENGEEGRSRTLSRPPAYEEIVAQETGAETVTATENIRPAV